MDVDLIKEAPFVKISAAETLTLTPNSDKVENMEIETRSFSSVYCFLKRVMDLEREGIKDNLGFLVVAVHAVFLESGFVVCNQDGSRLPQIWNSAAITTGISIQYTVPELVAQLREKNLKYATLKFSVMRNHVVVYGSLKGEPDVYRLHLDLSEVMPLLVFLSETWNENEEKEVCKFWKSVKDSLCFPLLIDMCRKNGLPLPPCFASLPTDLKFKVLDLLPGVDIARIGCTSSEMRCLTTNEELWKHKFMQEEFGSVNASMVASVSSWKEKFKRLWEKKKEMDRTTRELLGEDRRRIIRPWTPGLMPTNPFQLVGRYNDRFPALGDFGPARPAFGYPSRSARRNFSPHCNLGGWP